MIRLHDVSAFKGEQQAAQDQVVEDIRVGRYTVLLCTEVDRLDRRGVVAGIGFIYRVREAGGRVLIAAYEHSADPDEDIARDFAAAKRESRKRPVAACGGPFACAGALFTSERIKLAVRGSPAPPFAPACP